MKKILITGSSGLVGTRLIEMLESKYEFLPIRQAEIDITNKEVVSSRLLAIEFDLLLHLAAYTNVDKAEQEKELCHEINVEGTRNLFGLCQEKQAQMIYVSTDFIFDGRISNNELPIYTENSQPNPISYYGQTKHEGEQIVKDKAMIVRLSYPYRKEFEEKRDFVRTIKHLLEQGKILSMVEDSLITPTFIDDFVNNIDYLVEHFSTDMFHLIGADSMSPYEAGKCIARNWGLDENLIRPTTYDEYFKGKALRPQWAKICSTKKSGDVFSGFEEGLRKLL